MFSHETCSLPPDMDRFEISGRPFLTVFYTPNRSVFSPFFKSRPFLRTKNTLEIHRGLGYWYPRKSDYEDLRVKMRLENPIAQNDPRISDNFDRMSAVHPWSKLTHLSFKTRALSINFISELTGSCMVWIIAWNKTSYEKRGISRAPRRCPRKLCFVLVFCCEAAVKLSCASFRFPCLDV